MKGIDMTRLIVMAALLAAPLAAWAGACVYSPEGPKAAGAYVCSYVADAARCAEEAAGQGSPEWLKGHPQAFYADLGCNQAVAAEAKKAPKPPAKAPATK
jgi:hypothetical protein